jgi:hypothetical protein
MGGANKSFVDMRSLSGTGVTGPVLRRLTVRGEEFY